MTPAVALSALVWAALVLGLAMLSRRVALWRQGETAEVDWLVGLLALPKRYLVDVHHVVARDAYASRMHALVAGGLLAGSALAAMGVFAHSRLYWAVVALAFAAMLGGSLAVGARRYPSRPKRLSGGKFQVLPFLLLAYAVGGLVVAAAIALAAPIWAAWLGVVIAAPGLIGLALQLASGPMRHAAAGALHLVAHPRPARFAGVRDTALAPLDLTPNRLGVEAPADFGWNRLLSFDACISCGRCEIACPAFAAGQPLNPKRLIQDLAASMAPAGAAPYAGSPYPGTPAVAGAGGLHAKVIGADAMIHPDTLWSCTTCRACVEECPMMIEHVDAIVSLRRFETLEGRVAAKAEATLDDLRATDTQDGKALAARGDFAAGLTLPLIADRGEADVLLWLGEGAYDLRYGRTLRALVKLLQRADVDFAVLGAEERDCGDVARRLGDEATFQRLARENVATLSKYRFGRLLTADPHAFHVLANEYPVFGGDYEVVHHTRFLDELAQAGRLPFGAAPTGRIAYHDPCYLGRYNGEFDAPRSLLDRLGLDRVEMERSGRRAMCCGGGGGAPLSDVAGEKRIPDIRMEQVRASSATIVAVACPTCTAMLEGVTGPRPEVLDVAELTLRAVEAAA